MLNKIIAKLKKREFVGAEALRMMKRFRREEMAKYAERLLPRLCNANAPVRLEAIKALGQMRPHVLAKYVPDIVARLDDDEVEDVRFQAIEALRTLEPEVLTRYAQDIIPRLDDESEFVRYEAIKALGLLHSAHLPHRCRAPG